MRAFVQLALERPRGAVLFTLLFREFQPTTVMVDRCLVVAVGSGQVAEVIIQPGVVRAALLVRVAERRLEQVARQQRSFFIFVPAQPETERSRRRRARPR